MRVTALTVVGFVLLAGCAGGVVETTDSQIPVVETKDSKTPVAEPPTTPRSDREPDRAPPRRLAKPKPQQQPHHGWSGVTGSSRSSTATP